MKRALLLTVVLASGCNQASAPPAADPAAQTAAKNNKEMSDLLRKADAIAASAAAPAGAAAVAAVPQPTASASVPPANPPLAPVAAPQTAPAKPKADVKSKADVMRDEADTTFGARLSTLRRTAEAARLKKASYSQLCQGKLAEKADCQLLTADVADASKTIERELGDIDEAARHARIEPGVMRDLLAKYGF